MNKLSYIFRHTNHSEMPQNLYFFRSHSLWAEIWVKLVWLNNLMSASHSDTSIINISACHL